MMTSAMKWTLAVAILAGTALAAHEAAAQVWFGPRVGVGVGVMGPPGPFFGPRGPVVVGPSIIAPPIAPPPVRVYAGYGPYRSYVRVESGRPGYAVERVPDPTDDALRLLSAGRYTQSLAAIAPVIADQPNNGFARLVAAQAQFALGHYTESARLLHEGLPMLPEAEWGQLVARFWETFGSKERYTDLLRNLERHLKSQPDDASARFVLGYEYAYLGHHENAVKQLEKELNLMPTGDPLAQRLLQLFDTRPAPEELPSPTVTEQPAATGAAPTSGEL